ncbi:toxin YdaT domain-containing protein [Jinshanibacter sp. LJY008]|uniref:Toxin YdaT domain-containing protein n=1 Tax=Limnobaculum eriocheiris TaxID=2897391 RepID=A0A9X1MU90_9GAMM|nr:toxin YdaT family protein [Limnobaculum eriocheiris]MCD1124832.1 toxin YdaT domain-containing protein [Limnobaculum eriocheiris]
MHTKQATVAAEITEAYFKLGGGDLPLTRVDEDNATHNNKQRIFRWLDSCSCKSRIKIAELIPAIVAALPPERRAKLTAANSIAYMASEANRECTEAINACLLEYPDSEVNREVDEAIEMLLTLKRPTQNHARHNQ